MAAVGASSNSISICVSGNLFVSNKKLQKHTEEEAMKESLEAFMSKPVEERKQMLRNFKCTRPEHVPVIVHTNNNVEPLDSCKFSIHEDASVATLLVALRKCVGLGGHEALWVHVPTDDGGTLVSSSQIMGQLWGAYADKDDGFLHVVISKDDVFGTLPPAPHASHTC